MTRAWVLGICMLSASALAKDKDKRVFSLTISGYGVEAKPKLPVAIAFLPDRTLIVGPMNNKIANEQEAHGGIKSVALKAGKGPTKPLKKMKRGELNVFASGEDNSTWLALGDNMDSWEPVLESYRAATNGPGWIITTDDHAIVWPANFTLRSDGDLNPRTWPYELALGGSLENLIYLKGPFTSAQLPAPEQIAAEGGMESVGRGELKGTVSVKWFERTYTRDGKKWWQRDYYLPLEGQSVYLLRAQGSDDVKAQMFEAADAVAASFRQRH